MNHDIVIFHVFLIIFDILIDLIHDKAKQKNMFVSGRLMI